MDFTLVSTIFLLLNWIMSTQATNTKENSVLFRSILIIKHDNEFSSNEIANISMHIRKGIYPNISFANERVEIGEPITILIHSSDKHNRNISVNECWAYNEETYHNSSMNLQLTNKTSSFQQSLLTNQQMKEFGLYQHNVTMLLYINLISFKFPEKEYVYVKCNVELCYGSCTEKLKHKHLPPKLNSTISDEIYLQPTSKNDKGIFLRPQSSTTESILDSNCITKSKHLICFLKPRSECSKESENQHCFNIKPPSNCHTNSEDPQCHTKLLNINYYPSTCYPGTTDKHCNTNPPTDCYYSGSQNPKCNSNMASTCYPGSQELHCNSNFQPQNCYPGSQNPQCNLNQLNAISLPNCYPGSQNILCKLILSLSSNSQNRKCNNLIGFPSHHNFSLSSFPHNATNTECSTNTEKCNPHCTKYILKSKPTQPFICYFNITNPKCKHIRNKRSKDIFSTTARITEKATSKFDHNITKQQKFASSPSCSSDSIETRCNINMDIFAKLTTPSATPTKCLFQLFNHKCVLESATDKKLSYNPLLPPNCYPSSKDPRCAKPIIEESDSSIDQITNNPLEPANCYPGSKDPRCGTIK